MAGNVEKLGEIFKGLDHIGIDITNQCNMHCLHCYNRSNVGGGVNIDCELTDHELLNIADQIHEFEPSSFCFCGGEPLLRYELIVAMLKRMGNRITHPGLVTNGYLMTQGRANELKDLGLYTYQVSVDGANAKTHECLRGVCGSYLHAIAAVEMGCRAKIPFRAVAFSPTRFNVNQFCDVVEKMHELHVHEVRVQPLMRLGTAVSHGDIFPTRMQYIKLRHEIYESQRKYTRMKVEWGDPIDHLFRNVEVLSNFIPHLTLLSNGDIVLTPYIPIVIGSVRRHSLLEYWEAKIWKIWSRELIKSIAGFYCSEKDFSRLDIPVPQVFYADNVKFDLIDDGLLDISDEEFLNLYWKRIKLQRECIGQFNSESSRVYVKNLAASNVDINTIYLQYGKSHPNLSLLDVKQIVDDIIDGPDSSLHVDCTGVSESPIISQYRHRTLWASDHRLLLEFVENCLNLALPAVYYVRFGGLHGLRSGLVTRTRFFNGTHFYFAAVDRVGRIHGMCCLSCGHGDSSVVYGEALFVLRTMIPWFTKFGECFMRDCAEKLKHLTRKNYSKMRIILKKEDFEIQRMLFDAKFTKECELNVPEGDMVLLSMDISQCRAMLELDVSEEFELE